MPNEHQLTEKELEYLFGGKKHHKKISITSYIYGPLLALIVVAGIFTVLNFGSIKQKIIYWYENEYKVADDQTPVVENVIDANKVTSGQNTYKPPMQAIEDNHLLISSIDITAPINWNVPNTASATATGLETGLIHLANTAHPGEVGNVFITGHSSNYPWAKGDYNNIFALLDKVVVGEQIQIKFENKDYLYQVKQVKIVLPTEISVLQSNGDSVLTLSTCYPVGTSLKRLIVISEQIYPDKATNKPAASSTKIQTKEIPNGK